MKNILKMLEAYFVHGCTHNLSWVFSPKTQTSPYQVCTKCGMEFVYSGPLAEVVPKLRSSLPGKDGRSSSLVSF